MKKLIIISLATLLSLNVFSADEWKIKKDGVTISIVDKKFKGSFDNLSGTIIFSEDDLENSSFDVIINAPDIKVDGSGMQQKHVESDNWLDVEKFTTISFKSSSIVGTDSSFVAKGTLTMHGVEQEIEIPFIFEATETGNIFEGEIVVTRKDYSIGPDGNAVEEVTVSIKVEVTK